MRLDFSGKRFPLCILQGSVLLYTPKIFPYIKVTETWGRLSGLKASGQMQCKRCASGSKTSRLQNLNLVFAWMAG